MDVKQQEYFVAIVEEGSLSKAARKLYISQPTLSQFLSKLEQSINAQLLTRGNNNSLTLTEAGKLYYENAKKILRIRDDFMNKLSDLNKASSAKLSFGINAERGVTVLTHIMSELSTRYPDMRVETRQGGAYNLQELVANCELDMAFSAYSEKNPKLEYIDFPPLEVMLILPKSHPLAHLGTQTPEAKLPHMSLKCFEEEPFAMLIGHTVMRDIVDAYCQTNDIQPNIRIETHNIPTAFTVVDRGLCLSLCPYGLLPDVKGEFSYIGLNPPLYYHTGVYFNKASYQTNFIRDFLKAAKQLSTSTLSPL